MKRRDFLIGAATLGGAAALHAAVPRTARSAGPRDWTAARFRAERRFAQLAAGKIAYVEQGKGPVALFLHGYPLNGFQWRGALPRLAGLRRCIALDLMGLGHTEVPAQTDLSPAAQGEMVVAFLDRLGIAEADLVSNDSATGIAQLVAARHPGRVRSLLLTNGDVSTNSPPPPFLGAIEQARRGALAPWFEKQLEDNAFACSNDGLGRAFVHPQVTLTREVLESYLRPLVASEQHKQQAQAYAIAMLPNPLPAIEPRLRAFDKPVRIVWGRDNELFPDEWAHWLDRTFPGSRGIRFVEGVKLFFPEEVPELLADEARRLWQA